MKLKLKIHKLEKAIALQFLEMDSSLRGKEVIYQAGSSDELSLYSFRHPDICDGALYLPGKHGHLDNRVEDYYFDDNKIRDEFIEKIIRTIKKVFQASSFKQKKVYKNVYDYGGLKILLKPGPQIIFQVLEMDEKYRGAGLLFEHKGWTIWSNANPAVDIEGKKIYLRGNDRDYDYEPQLFSSDFSDSLEIVDVFDAWFNNPSVIVIENDETVTIEA